MRFIFMNDEVLEEDDSWWGREEDCVYIGG